MRMFTNDWMFTNIVVSICSSFRSGKMYLFDLPMTEVGSFTNFAEGWYKNAASQSVPAQPSPLLVTLFNY